MSLTVTPGTATGITSDVSASLRAGVEAASDYAKNKDADSTQDGYAADFRLFAAWCEANGLPALPATIPSVATYIAIEAQRGIRPTTIDRRLAAIRYTHIEAGYGSPTDSRHIRDVMAGIRNTHGIAPDRKAPATADRLAAMLACIPVDTLTGKRDRAILALGFSAALRRSELVALVVDDVERVPEGVRLTIRKSKTDQCGEGYVIAIPDGTNLRPLAALREWLAAAGITSGPLFRSINKAGRLSVDGLSGRTVANLVKQYAALAGLKAEDFSGHSLRAGFITSAAAAGATIWKMQAISRHKTLDVLSGYVRDADAFKDHAGEAFL